MLAAVFCSAALVVPVLLTIAAIDTDAPPDPPARVPVERFHNLPRTVLVDTDREWIGDRTQVITRHIRRDVPWREFTHEHDHLFAFITDPIRLALLAAASGALVAARLTI